MTLILGFDTSGPHCTAALLAGDGLRAARHETLARGQAERLMPMLEEVLAEAGHGWRDLTAIGVGVGPGNFTGIRIAVSAARGLALGLGIPAVGVSGCEARMRLCPPGMACAIPAPRDQLYLCDRDDPAALPRLEHPALFIADPDDVRDRDTRQAAERCPRAMLAEAGAGIHTRAGIIRSFLD